MTESEATADPKRLRILDGAMKVFLAYGYSRTTMDDIARAAEMSRPALYLVFKNKTEIYRAIGAMLLDNSVEQARIALSTEGGFAERLMLAIENALFAMMRTIAASPHGAEILDMKSTLAADLAARWRDGLRHFLTGAIEGEARLNQVDLDRRGLSAQGLAEMLLDGLEGMKMRISDPDEQRTAARRLVRVMELAIQP